MPLFYFSRAALLFLIATQLEERRRLCDADIKAMREAGSIDEALFSAVRTIPLSLVLKAMLFPLLLAYCRGWSPSPSPIFMA